MLMEATKKLNYKKDFFNDNTQVQHRTAIPSVGLA